MILDPCPFCKTSAAVIMRDTSVGAADLWGVCFAECPCGARGPKAQDENQAGEMWNRREGVVTCKIELSEAAGL